MVSHLERRTIEAELLARMYSRLADELGEDKALSIIADTLRQAAHDAGKDFARQAPGGPSLEHFATIVDVWKNGGAVHVTDSTLSGNVFTITVGRCRFVETYRDMGLSDEFARILSCDRDLPFAQGYSAKLRFSREEYIGIGSAKCLFRYQWTE